MLGEIEAGDVPEQLVFTKTDAVDRETRRPAAARRIPGAVAVSARTGRRASRSCSRVSATGCARSTQVVELRMPYDRGDVLAALHREGDVLVEVHDDGGTRVRARLPQSGRLGPRHASTASAPRRPDSLARMVDAGVTPAGFVPPPYPHDRLDAFRRLADGGARAASSTARSATRSTRSPTSCSHALDAAAPGGDAYPATIGSLELRDAAAEWIAAPASASTLDPADVLACIGTKELVASLPHLLAPARPVARHRALPGDLVPDLRDGRGARRAAGGAGAARRRLAPRPRAG